VVDFPELLLRSFELLSRNQILREHYSRRFVHILVDEFQDTNRLQYRWLKLFASPNTKFFCVGDDDQSIYAFRGANVGNMADFERDFKVRKVIRLEQNYRSHGNILDAANAIIKNNAARLGKNLWTEAGSGEPIRVFEAYSDGDEARWIVEEVKALVRDGHSRAGIALLYRSNAQSRVLEHALFSAGLPYRVYGGLRFFERQEIKHALAYLRLIANGDDDTAFSRVVNFPARGIGARSLEQLADAAKSRGSSLYAAVAQVGGKAGGALAAFTALIATLRDSAGLALPELVGIVLDGSGLRDHYRAEKEGQERLANLDELVNAAASFVAEEGNVGEEGELSADLAAFLSHAALEAGEHQAGEGDDALQLMTVHSAKGLEFDAVFISGLEEGLFPHENSSSDLDSLEEERRLMYVAITRAQRLLTILWTKSRSKYGTRVESSISRFVFEMRGEKPPKGWRASGALNDEAPPKPEKARPRKARGKARS
jgi:DNA helicase-2/ATP-dependent DNA helicase PcrA